MLYEGLKAFRKTYMELRGVVVSERGGVVTELACVVEREVGDFLWIV